MYMYTQRKCKHGGSYDVWRSHGGLSTGEWEGERGEGTENK